MGLLTPCFVPSGGFSYTMMVLRGGIVFDEIDTGIIAAYSLKSEKDWPVDFGTL